MSGWRAIGNTPDVETQFTNGDEVALIPPVSGRLIYFRKEIEIQLTGLPIAEKIYTPASGASGCMAGISRRGS